MEFGLYSFGDNGPDPHTGERRSPAQRLRDLLEEIELAEQVGLDVYGVGEHHRTDFPVSAPAMVLAAAAARTRRIRLTSAVTVLGSEDPVRVYQQYATLDLLSNGRAEVMAGRGSFIESFPLFGHDLADYERLFEERLDLLLRVRENEVVDWPGGLQRPAIRGRSVLPRALQQPLPVWVAVGGTPASAVRAGTLGLPMALAIIGGMPERFVPFVELYRDAGRRAGHDAASLPVGINIHGFVAPDSQRAADLVYPSYSAVMDRIGRERGWPPSSREQFNASLTPRGALAIGSPAQVAEKLVQHQRWFGHQRQLVQMTVGTLPHADVMRSIELFGTQVVPAVRRELAGAVPSP